MRIANGYLSGFLGFTVAGQLLLAQFDPGLANAGSAAKTASAKPGAATAAGKAQLNPCDALAGHPGDPAHKGAGVSNAAVVPAEAIKQCELAVKQQPKNARFRFQLGRAYWLGQQYDKAVESLALAEEMRYAPSYHYLGLAYEQGRVKGEPADKALAADLYKMAVTGGFDAEAVRVDRTPVKPAPVIEKASDLDGSQFKEANWVRALFSGDMDTLNRSRNQMLVYARGMQAFMTLDPNEYDETCLKVADASLEEKIGFEETGAGDGKIDLNKMLSEVKRAMRSNPRMLEAESQRNEATMQNGVDDMNVLSEDYGSCAGPVVRRVYNNLRRFLREKPQVKQSAPLKN